MADTPPLQRKRTGAQAAARRSAAAARSQKVPDKHLVNSLREIAEREKQYPFPVGSLQDAHPIIYCQRSGQMK